MVRIRDKKCGSVRRYCSKCAGRMGSRGQERDFETEISGNAMVYGVTVEWVAEERGEKIVGMQDIKEWRGQAAG